jgi:hypothetical protein
MSRQINRSSTGQTAKDAFALGANRVAKAAPLILIALIALSGCSSHSAPSFVLFGAFFPAWMLYAIIGIFGAIASRGIFVAAGLDSVLPFQLFVCSSVGLVVAAVSPGSGNEHEVGRQTSSSISRQDNLAHNHRDRRCSGALRRAQNLDPSVYRRRHDRCRCRSCCCGGRRQNY